MSKRNNCQIFTPIKIVQEMLDNISFSDNVFGKKVLENSFGEGNFLIEIVKRYIEDGIAQKKSLKRIKEQIEKNIIGIEFDIEKVKICLTKLSEMASKYKIKNVNWNLLNGDSLKTKFDDAFDYIIGNPPYITYKDLSNEERVFIRENYKETCGEGKPDYYYAFIENSIKNLRNDGIFTYLIPNNIYKSRFANKTREFIKPLLHTIVDFGSIKLFEKKLVSSTIIVCKKNNDTNSRIKYINKDTGDEKYISRWNLLNKWCFTSCDIPVQSVRFGDYFHAACSVATLLNEAFVLKNYIEHKNKIIINNHEIEMGATRIAVSPRSLQYGKNERIIFPYFYDNDRLSKYQNDSFGMSFPGAVAYLEQRKKELLLRKSDGSARWFEFGRSQALCHLNQKKLLLSTVITKIVNIYLLGQKTIPYSGIYVIKKGQLTLEDAMNILKSNKFMDYVESIGINASGESLRITSTDVNEYMFEMEI